MRLGMTMTPRLVQVLECSVCKQRHDDDKADAVAVEAHIFGSVAFAICPCCGQKAPNMTAKAYLARAAAWIQRRSLVVLREKLGRCRKEGRDVRCDFDKCPQDVVHLVMCPLDWPEDEDP